MKNIIACSAILLGCSCTGAFASTRAPQTPCAGEVIRHEVAAPDMDATITVDVWLPSDYRDQASNTYPVIYANDGQNMFDPAGSFSGVAWDIDDTLEQLDAEGIAEAAVVVGIHCTPNRFGDYAPAKAIRAAGLENTMCATWGGVELKSDEYLSFIVDILKPMIDTTYRVRRDMQSTTILGSSMGGLISAYAMCEYPEVFGNAVCLSTHWSGALDNSTPQFGQAVIDYMVKKLPADGRHRLYLDHGTKGLDSYYRKYNDMAIAVAEEKGYIRGFELMTHIDEGADHNESAWRNRLSIPLQFILSAHLPASCTPSDLPEDIQDGLILHCFEWKLTDIINELPSIAKAGFKAVQISPMQRNVSVGDVWYDVYRPFDYRFIDNGLGTRDEMRRLCVEAARLNISVVTDIVANHGTCVWEEHDKWWDTNGRMVWGNTIDWNSRWSETHEALGDYGESNSDDPDVQTRTRNYVLELKSLGVKGLRWDAAKHIALPSEGCQFWKNVTDVQGMWNYGEILGSPAQKPELLGEYAQYMSVTNPGGSSAEGNSYEWVGVPMSKQVLWVESHDTFSNSTTGSQTIPQDEIDRRWALTAARADATALYLSRPAFGSPTDIKVGVKGATDYTAAEVSAANHFHNAMIGMPETMRRLEDGVTAVYRGKGVVITRQGGPAHVEIPSENLSPDGVYRDEVGSTLFTLSNGKLSGDITSAVGVAVVYDYGQATATSPRVEMMPSLTSFSSPTCFISLRTVNSTSASYAVDGGAAVEFSGATSFEIGRGVAPGTDITIEWTASDAEGTTNSGVYTVTKMPSDRACNVYLRYDDPAFDNLTFYTFVYNSDGESVQSWPGQSMSRDESLTLNGLTGCWLTYQVPSAFAADGMAMVSSSGAIRYPADNEPGIPLLGQSLVFEYINGVWHTSRITDSADMKPIDSRGQITVARPAPGGIVAGDTTVDVFNIAGDKVGCVGAHAYLSLPAGFYIARSGASSVKLIVR